MATYGWERAAGLPDRLSPAVTCRSTAKNPGIGRNGRRPSWSITCIWMAPLSSLGHESAGKVRSSSGRANRRGGGMPAPTSGQPYRAGRHVNPDDNRESGGQQPGEPAVAAAEVHDRQRRVEMVTGPVQAPVQLGALGDVPEHLSTGTGPMHPGPELFPTASSLTPQSDGGPDQPGQQQELADGHDCLLPSPALSSCRIRGRGASRPRGPVGLENPVMPCALLLHLCS
jgi:hypothetical protein